MKSQLCGGCSVQNTVSLGKKVRAGAVGPEAWDRCSLGSQHSQSEALRGLDGLTSPLPPPHATGDRAINKAELVHWEEGLGQRPHLGFRRFSPPNNTQPNLSPDPRGGQKGRKCFLP